MSSASQPSHSGGRGTAQYFMNAEIAVLMDVTSWILLTNSLTLAALHGPHSWCWDTLQMLSQPPGFSLAVGSPLASRCGQAAVVGLARREARPLFVMCGNACCLSGILFSNVVRKCGRVQQCDAIASRGCTAGFESGLSGAFFVLILYELSMLWDAAMRNPPSELS